MFNKGPYHFIYNCEIFSQTGNQHKDKAVIYCACAPSVAHIARAMAFSRRFADLLAIYVCFLCVFILQTYIDENGDYHIYINSRINCEQQRQAERHERNHIKMGDFYLSHFILQSINNKTN
jgi:hypothetical protein